MGVELDIHDFFQLIRRLEKKASLFYRRASDMSPDQVCRDLFDDLAKMESDHEQVFEGIGHHMAGRRLARGADRYAKHWPAIAGRMLSDLDASLARKFSGRRAREDILRAAMDFEKETIVFFSGLKEMIPFKPDKQEIDRVIREEVGHIISLGGQLASGR